MTRLLAFRFDVDTELCLRSGVPRLLELGEELSAHFTFFVNPGRAIRRRDVYLGRQNSYGVSGPKLSAFTKLGWAELVYLVALNPPALPRHAGVLRRAEQLGHEIGLHGGCNHGDWARNACTWSKDRLAWEVDFGLSKLQQSRICKPELFASPGWNSPPKLPAVLRDRGFRAVADSHGEAVRPVDLDNGIARIHTGLTGEPGGIGYLEFMRAQGAKDRAILADFLGRLNREPEFVCFYDHPFYAGRHEISLLEKMINLARRDGWRVGPMGSALPSKNHQ